MQREAETTQGRVRIRQFKFAVALQMQSKPFSHSGTIRLQFGPVSCEGWGSSTPRLHRGSAQGLGLLRNGCKGDEEDSVEDTERVHVLGVVK